MKELQSDQVIVTRDGRPLALVVGVEGLDQKQVARQKEETLSRAEVKKEIKRRSLRERANKAKLNGGK